MIGVAIHAFLPSGWALIGIRATLIIHGNIPPTKSDFGIVLIKEADALRT